MREPAGACPQGQLLVAECSWGYGATENMVWEGQGTQCSLVKGDAIVTLMIDNTTLSAENPMADRNIDTLMITTNATDIQSRYTSFETGHTSLPLDGLLSQAGEVYAKISSRNDSQVQLVVPYSQYNSVGPDNHLTSAYWNQTVRRLVSGCTYRGTSQTPSMTAAGGGPNCRRIATRTGQVSSLWTEVGSMLDPFNHGNWLWPAAGQGYNLTIGVANSDVLQRGGGGLTLPDQHVTPIITFTVAQGSFLELQFDASTRAARRISPQSADFYAIVAALERQTPDLEPLIRAGGRLPTSLPVYVPSVFPTVRRSPRDSPPSPPPDLLYNQSLHTFLGMYPNTTRSVFYGVSIGKCWQEDTCEAMVTKSVTKLVSGGLDPDSSGVIIDLGDEVRLMDLSPDCAKFNITSPPCQRAASLFAAWAAARNLSADQLGCESGACMPNKTIAAAASSPRLFYYSQRWDHDFGIAAFKTITDAVHKHIPGAEVGANFSPGTAFTCSTFQFIRSFRENALTLPCEFSLPLA
jgi:hypothetical protein